MVKTMEKLFLKGWSYNSYLIINELAALVKAEGGKIVYDFPYINTYKEKEIVNRSILENISEIQELLKGKTEEEIKQNQYAAEKQEELKELQKIDNEPKKVLFSNYINFELDNKIYYIQLQDNPFFEDYIIKEEAEETLEGYLVKYNHYMENLDKTWISECESIKSFYQTLTEKQIKILALRLFEQIKNAKNSEIVTNKKRVNNYYNNSYHYEYIKEERNKKYKILKMEA